MLILISFTTQQKKINPIRFVLKYTTGEMDFRKQNVENLKKFSIISSFLTMEQLYLCIIILSGITLLLMLVQFIVLLVSSCLKTRSDKKKRETKPINKPARDIPQAAVSFWDNRFNKRN